MILYTVNHTYKYECEKICRIFFPTEKIVFGDTVSEENERYVYTEIDENGDKIVFYCKAVINGKTAEFLLDGDISEKENDSFKERMLAKAAVHVLKDITGISPPWGILTGVRPAKLMRNYINQVGGEKAKEIFSDFLEVSPERTRLAFTVASYENTCIEMSGKNSFSLYISIPFCPTRCSYCSFVSHSVEKAGKLVPDYVEKLCEEIKEAANLARELQLKLETVYIGGGTPTSLSAEQIEKITSAVNENFSVLSLREFTVEAGRPDTVSEEKLKVLKNAGVTRISINPQTFSDGVLEEIGRKHTSADTLEKFELAKSFGFDSINMDFIAGLPGDSVDGFKASLDKAVTLAPENITVHTLCLKRAANLPSSDNADKICRDTREMVEYANTVLSENGYFPYYMYRQSKSVGNLENVGWCKKDKPCLYNIFMMEEIHTVLALGAGGVTKLTDPENGRLERVCNYKYPYEYISRFETVSERKNSVRAFFENGKKPSE